MPTDKSILVEAFDRFLIIHSCFGEVFNNTLGEVFEELMIKENLVRVWHSDGYRILFELTVNTNDLALDELVKKLFYISEDFVETACNTALHRHIPFGYYMKFVAERFGALRRGLFMGEAGLKELALRFRGTPIYDETLREVNLLYYDLDCVKKVLRRIRDGLIRVDVFRARERPTHLTYHILNRYVEVPELIAPETIIKDSLERMKNALNNEIVNLLCFNCSNLTEGLLVKNISDTPECSLCGSNLLAMVFWSTSFTRDALNKKKSHLKLRPDEEKALVNARRSADLVLSYGKKAIIAQSVYGIGPQTAAKLLAKMHDSEEEFYQDLLDAKLKFIATRPYWDR